MFTCTVAHRVPFFNSGSPLISPLRLVNSAPGRPVRAFLPIRANPPGTKVAFVPGHSEMTPAHTITSSCYSVLRLLAAQYKRRTGLQSRPSLHPSIGLPLATHNSTNCNTDPVGGPAGTLSSTNARPPKGNRPFAQNRLIADNHLSIKRIYLAFSTRL